MLPSIFATLAPSSRLSADQRALAPPEFPGFIATPLIRHLPGSGNLLFGNGRCPARCHSGRAIRTDIPRCIGLLFHACCHDYPGGTSSSSSLLTCWRQRPSPLLWRVGSHDDISRPAPCSHHIASRMIAALLAGVFSGCTSAHFSPHEPLPVLLT